MPRSRRKPAAQRYAERKIRVALDAVRRREREAAADAAYQHWTTHIAPFEDAWCEIVDTRNPTRSA